MPNLSSLVVQGMSYTIGNTPSTTTFSFPTNDTCGPYNWFLGNPRQGLTVTSSSN